MSTFYLKDIENDICHLSENDSRHAVRVLRHKKNDFISVVNGKGLLAKAKIIEAHPKKTKIKVIRNKKDPDKRDYFVSNKKIEKYGYKPRVSLETGIKELSKIYEINDFKDNKNNY